MRPVYLHGIGLTPVGEHWENSLRELGFYAIEAAQKDLETVGAGDLEPQALYVANMYASELSHQAHLGALLADFAGLRNLEAVTVEAAGASGGAAMRQAVLAIASGAVDTALVVGVEKMTDKVGPGMVAATATTTDADWEATQGVTPTALAALLMRRYMHTHHVALDKFAGFSVNAHANAKANPNAMFRNTLTAEAYLKAGMVSDPVNMFDTAPDADGAAALVLSARPGPLKVAASAMATDTLAVHDRPDPLAFEAVRLSANRAFRQANLSPDDIHVAEFYDAFTIFTTLSLEASGFAAPGQGWTWAANGDIGPQGKLPIATFGGLKARGNPGGAAGVYQLGEVGLQLRGAAGANQLKKTTRYGLAQCLGGAGASAVTHILEKL